MQPLRSPELSWIAAAHLFRPQGRRGELLAEPLTDLKDVLVAGREVALAAPGVGAHGPEPGDGPATLQIEAAWSPTGKNAGRVVLKLSGCDTISQAESLAGQDLLVRTTDLPLLDPDTFFVADLLGCDFYDGHTRAGIIVDVQFPTSPDGHTRLEDAAPLLAVSPHPEAEGRFGSDKGLTNKLTLARVAEPTLVPFVRAWLESVDIPARRVVMHLPAGLLEPRTTDND